MHCQKHFKVIISYKLCCYGQHFLYSRSSLHLHMYQVLTFLIADVLLMLLPFSSIGINCSCKVLNGGIIVAWRHQSQDSNFFYLCFLISHRPKSLWKTMFFGLMYDAGTKQDTCMHFITHFVKVHLPWSNPGGTQIWVVFTRREEYVLEQMLDRRTSSKDLQLTKFIRELKISQKRQDL